MTACASQNSSTRAPWARPPVRRLAGGSKGGREVPSLIFAVVQGSPEFLGNLENFGVDSRVAWMPDTFGFSAALPQIMKKCQIPYFATQKLTRQDPEAEPFPYNLFWWE